jgi:hypothetical protein
LKWWTKINIYTHAPHQAKIFFFKVSETSVHSMTNSPIKLKEKGVNVKHLTLFIINKDLILPEINKQNLIFCFNSGMYVILDFNKRWMICVCNTLYHRQLLSNGLFISCNCENTQHFIYISYNISLPFGTEGLSWSWSYGSWICNANAIRA